MASEVSYRHIFTGLTLYFTIRNDSRQMWNTAGTPNFETLTVANWADYDVALSESPASSYFYVGTFPAISGNMIAGYYWVDIYARAGASPAITDSLVASYFGYWDGTTYKFWGTDTLQVGGTNQTAGDIPARLPAALTSNGNMKASLLEIIGSTLSEGATGRIRDAWQAAWNVAAAAWTALSINQTGDSFTRLGAPAGASISADIAAVKTVVDTLATRLTAARAGYLDFLNTGGLVASQADVNALNQSASRRVILTSVQTYERPESGSTDFFIEARTYDGDGALVNADSTPTLTATGITSGNLSGNLSAISNPSTGLYRWTYNVESADALEAIRFDFSPTIGGSQFPISLLSQTVDTVAATFTTADRAMITAGYNKLPSKSFLAGTNNADGDIELNESTGDFNATQQTRIQTQAAAALTIYDPPTRLEATSDKNEILTAVGDVPTAVENRQEMDSNSTKLAFIRGILEADIFIDINVTPWDIVFIQKGTGAIGVGTELLRQNLKDVNGANLTNTTTVVGQAVA